MDRLVRLCAAGELAEGCARGFRVRLVDGRVQIDAAQFLAGDDAARTAD